MKIESIKAKLLNYSRKNNKTHQNTLTKFFQERFLYRLSESGYKENFILKGGALIYTINNEGNRHTKDIDLLANNLSADEDNLRKIFEEICEVSVDDGVIFESDSMRIEAIQKDGKYNGTRIRISCKLGNILHQLQVDIGVGDHVTPGPKPVAYPIILPGLPAPQLIGYPIETQISEKFEAMISLAEFNSRLKDFYDIYNLVESCNKEILNQAIQNTFSTRKTKVSENHPVFQEDFYEEKERKKQWSIYLKKNELNEIDFKEVWNVILTHLYPIYKELL